LINENRIFENANSLFIQKKFKEALFNYSLLISNFPDNKEYPIYALLCDISIEDESKALSLFDYFSVLKKDGLDEAIDYIKDVINAYDGDIEKMMGILEDIAESNINNLEAINYSDFNKTVEQRGSFKLAFEDIMFSTKVAIDNREDFYDFITKLIDNGFDNTAYTYLDGFNEYFNYDNEIIKLYKKLEEKQNEIKHKR
jgi:tetratricopeptide (TPR) repeat protein